MRKQKMYNVITMKLKNANHTQGDCQLSLFDPVNSQVAQEKIDNTKTSSRMNVSVNNYGTIILMKGDVSSTQKSLYEVSSFKLRLKVVIKDLIKSLFKLPF